VRSVGVGRGCAADTGRPHGRYASRERSVGRFSSHTDFGRPRDGGPGFDTNRKDCRNICDPRTGASSKLQRNIWTFVHVALAEGFRAGAKGRNFLGSGSLSRPSVRGILRSQAAAPATRAGQCRDVVCRVRREKLWKKSAVSPGPRDHVATKFAPGATPWPGNSIRPLGHSRIDNGPDVGTGQQLVGGHHDGGVGGRLVSCPPTGGSPVPVGEVPIGDRHCYGLRWGGPSRRATFVLVLTPWRPAPGSRRGCDRGALATRPPAQRGQGRLLRPVLHRGQSGIPKCKSNNRLRHQYDAS
jgi:hypothetical protein